MESPRKFNDCYFYYYSTCKRGDSCVFRHEPSALGCETMCAAWQEGKCLEKNCSLRHMELRKNRKQIPCFWENQPGGCRKKHCPFMHKNPDARTDGIAPSQPIPPSASQPSVSVPESLPAEGLSNVQQVPPVQGVPSVSVLWPQRRQVVIDPSILGVIPQSDMGRVPLQPHEPQSPYAMPVDPLVVNFEDESDNESAASTTPTKNQNNGEPAKSQELLLLEKIQAEAAAFYNYEAMEQKTKLRTKLTTKYDRLSLDEITGKPLPENRSSLDFKILSLDEIRAKKRASDSQLSMNLKKRKSSQETIVPIDPENKIIKLVRSNSVVYRKMDQKETPTKIEVKPVVETRKRTVSEIECEIELEDCYEFKKIKVDESLRPIIDTVEQTDKAVSKEKENKNDESSDSEIELVSEEICHDTVKISDVIDLDDKNVSEGENGDTVINLSDDEDIELTDYELGLVKNVPDVVASCRSRQTSEKDIVNDIDAYLNDDL